MQGNYNFDLCYKCKMPYSQICKCKFHNKRCENGHVWVECPTHSTFDNPKIIVNPRVVSKIHNEDFICLDNCVDVEKI
jgi:hypothetical protein